MKPYPVDPVILHQVYRVFNIKKFKLESHQIYKIITNIFNNIDI